MTEKDYQSLNFMFPILKNFYEKNEAKINTPKDFLIIMEEELTEYEDFKQAERKAAIKQLKS